MESTSCCRIVYQNLNFHVLGKSYVSNPWGCKQILENMNHAVTSFWVCKQSGKNTTLWVVNFPTPLNRLLILKPKDKHTNLSIVHYFTIDYLKPNLIPTEDNRNTSTDFRGSWTGHLVNKLMPRDLNCLLLIPRNQNSKCPLLCYQNLQLPPSSIMQLCSANMKTCGLKIRESIK